MDTLLSPLITAGMDPKVAEIYLILAKNGEMDVPNVLKQTSLSRTTVYESLSELLAQGFLEYQKRGRVALYRPVHPNKIYSLLQNKKNELTLLESELGGVVNALLGPFQLMQNKPGVRFFEGQEEIKKALFETLSTKSEIVSFVEGGVVDKYIKEINAEYIQERLRRKILKKIITTDTPEAHERSKALNREAFTQTKFIDVNKYPFKTSVQVWDDATLYLTFTEKNMMGFLIRNNIIAEFHKSLFRFLWESLPSQKN